MRIEIVAFQMIRLSKLKRRMEFSKLMTNTKVMSVFAIVAVAAMMGAVSIAPAYAASSGNSHQNEKILYAENDSDVFLDFVQLTIVQTDDGPVATADVFVDFICSSTTVLADDEYEWGQGEAWVSFDAGSCGQVDVTWNGQGRAQQIHASDAGDSTCDETGFKGTLNAIGKTSNTTGSASGFPINHTVGSTTFFGDGFSAHGISNGVVCEATSGQRP